VTGDGALFDAIARHTSDVILVAGLNGACTYVSPACTQLTGYSPEELLSMPAPQLVHPDDRARLLDLWKTLAISTGCTPTYRILRKDGRWVWIESAVNTVHNPVTGQTLGVVAISRDITLRKRAGDKIGVMEAASNAMVMVGSDGLIAFVNTQTEKLFGYKEAELLGRPIETLVSERGHSNHSGRRTAFLTAPAVHAMGAGRDLSGLRKDGTEVPVDVGLYPIGTPDGQFVLASIVGIAERENVEDRCQLFQALVEGVRDYGIFMLDPEGYVLSWNEGAARIKGYAESEIVGQHFSRFYSPEDVEADHPAEALRIARIQGRFAEEGWRIRRDGSRFWASVLITIFRDKGGNFRGFSKLTRDVTERKLYEERLRESERGFRLLADAMPQIVWTARPDGYVSHYNDRWYEFTGLSRGIGGDRSWKPFLHADDVQPVTDAWYSAIGSGQPYEIHCRLRERKAGDYRWHLARAVPLRDDSGVVEKWVGTATDVDDYKRLSEELEHRVDEKTAELRRSLVEKTMLLKEVHHRVKNNLQVVCSLLSMQIASDVSFFQPLNDAHSRVLAMSLIHEQIYRSDTLTDLNFAEYVEILADRLFSAYCVDPSRIRLELSIQPIVLTVDDAIPCGLILNELISNSLKHAFRDGRKGAIRVSLGKAEEDRVELMVADNGIGMPPDFQLEKAPSLGLQVVDTLIRQLRAELAVEAGVGATGASFRFSWKAPRDAEQAVPV
jgi:PAS domain S-box-containing protein